MREVAPEPLAQWAVLAPRTPDRHLNFGGEQGSEEHQPLDVIKVEVRQQNVHSASTPCERQPERSDSCAGVEDQLSSVAGRDLHAGRVSAETGGGWAGHGDRSADTPEPDSQLDHSRCSDQNITIAPCSPTDPTSGN